MKDDLLDLVQYNDWANARMADTIGELPETAQSTPITSSFGSIRETLAHIASAEWIWLRRWQGESPAAAPPWVAGDSTDQLLGRLEMIRTDRLAFLAPLADADLSRPLEYRNLAGNTYRNTLADLVRHVVNHSTYHRGQLATQLRQAGYVPPATDFIVYRRETAPA